MHLPQQVGRRPAGRSRLSALGGALGRQHPGMDVHGAALSHQRTTRRSTEDASQHVTDSEFLE